MQLSTEETKLMIQNPIEPQLEDKCFIVLNTLMKLISESYQLLEKFVTIDHAANSESEVNESFADNSGSDETGDYVYYFSPHM